MIFLHCNLDGSLSRRAPPYLQENFDLLLDRFDTSPTPFLLVFKAEISTFVFQPMFVVLVGQTSSLVSHHRFVNCANGCHVFNSCFVH